MNSSSSPSPARAAARRHLLAAAALALVLLGPAAYLYTVTRELRTVQSALDRQRLDQEQSLKIIRGREARRAELLMRADRTLKEDNQNPASAETTETESASLGGPGVIDARLMSDPEYQAKLRLQIRGQAQAAFASLFQKLQLNEETRNRMCDLITERKMTTLDAQDLARQAGLSSRKATGRNEVSQLMKKLLVPFDEEIRALTGDKGFEEYLHYNQTLSVRTTVSSLAEHLTATAEPLRSEQREQLVDLLVAAKKNSAPSTSGGDPSQLLTSASSFLSPTQLLALRDLQRHEATQHEISTMILAKTSR